MSETKKLDRAVIGNLRSMARQGRTPSDMYRELQRSLDSETNILTVLDYFRQSFCLSLADAKPLAALTRNGQRDIEDEPLLNKLLQTAISDHRSDWESLDSMA